MSNHKIKLLFAGTPEFAATSLDALIKAGYDIAAVYTQPDRPAGRGQKLTASAVKELALKHNLPIEQPLTLKDPIAQEKLRSYQADVMIVAAYGLILPQAVLDIPKHGCINIHASWLPRWRGAAPIQRAILAGDTQTGISIMQMDKGLDTGDMLCTQTCEITQRDTAETLLAKLSVLGGEAIIDALTDLQKNNVIRTPQNNALATYAAKLTKAEAQLDWTKSALELDRMVRGFNPWPVAFTHFGETILRIWSAQPLAMQTGAVPGTIIGLGNEGIDVVCGQGILRLLEVQWPNAKRQTVTQTLTRQEGGLSLGDKFLYKQ